MVQLVTLEQAKRRLRIFHDDEDADLLDAVQQVSEAVMDYLKKPHNEWSDAQDGSGDGTKSDAPFVVQAAVLVWLAYLWEFRGDSQEKPPFEYGDPPPTVKSLLYRLRAPALA